MGNNQAFTDFEATVIATYNKDVLDQELLSAFMEMHRDSDIDTGGMVGTLAKDGLDVQDIVLKIFDIPVPKKPDLPEDYKTWDAAQQTLNDVYWDAHWEAFNGICERFGWR